MSWVSELARPEIVALKAYEHAAWEPGLARLHANEFPWRRADDESLAGLNLYPEPQPKALIERLARLYQVSSSSLLVSRGSDEAIDLLVRAFCRAGEDAVVICPPTFGMYAIAAQIQGAEVIRVPLQSADGFALDTSALLKACSPAVKLVFLCSPNNPTGHLLSEESILKVVKVLAGRALVVVDEAYIEFSARTSLAPLVARRPNLVVLRTLSKAHGLAGARLGTLIADPEVVSLLRKLIAPYAISQLTLEAVLRLLAAPHVRKHQRRIRKVRAERERLTEDLIRLSRVRAVLPSEANFVLVRFDDAAAALRRARGAGLLVRDARGYPGFQDALRVSIGTPLQNTQLLEAWS